MRLRWCLPMVMYVAKHKLLQDIISGRGDPNQYGTIYKSGFEEELYL